MESVAVDLVTKKMAIFENSKEDLKSCSLLQQYMKNPNLKFQDLIGVSGDLLLGKYSLILYKFMRNINIV